jgi:type II secretory pathway pseudopilin PulG
LAAVASIIAILSLILVPIVRGRLEVARFTAAIDDLRTIEIAQTLANADTGFFYRLCDLDNPAADLETFNDPTSTLAERATAMRPVPNGTWNTPFTPAEQSRGGQIGRIGATWNGPYTTFNNTKFLPLTTLAGLAGHLFRQVNIDSFPATNILGTGPMPIYRSTAAANTDPFLDDFANLENHPIDPWGSAYLFFGPGRMGIAAGSTEVNPPLNNESNFGTAVAYSLGPDGRPGNIATTNPLAFFRETGILGTEDDITRIF